jgi:Domain of unknown function (DUF4136)
MASLHFPRIKMPLVLAALCLIGLVAGGCDDHVQITRDPDARLLKGATWAWQPVTGAAVARDSRKVLSRDTPASARDDRREIFSRDNNGNNDIVRDRVKQAIQQALMSKGLVQVSDPANAEFLVDYHYATDRRTETVQTLYPGPYYPGLVCGPYGCWQGWGYGPAAVGYERIHFRAGTIVFDFTQQANRHLVYRAVGEKPVQRDTFSLTQNEINELVNHLLKDLKVSK